MATIDADKQLMDGEVDIDTWTEPLLPYHQYMGQFRGQLVAVLVDGKEWSRWVIASVPIHFGTREQKREELARQINASRYAGSKFIVYEVAGSEQLHLFQHQKEQYPQVKESMSVEPRVVENASETDWRDVPNNVEKRRRLFLASRIQASRGQQLGDEKMRVAHPQE